MSGRISISEIRDKILFQILCSVASPKIQILGSKSGFPNRTLPKSLNVKSVVPSATRLVSMEANSAPFIPLPLLGLHFAGI